MFYDYQNCFMVATKKDFFIYYYNNGHFKIAMERYLKDYEIAELTSAVVLRMNKKDPY